MDWYDENLNNKLCFLRILHKNTLKDIHLTIYDALYVFFGCGLQFLSYAEDKMRAVPVVVSFYSYKASSI